MAPSFPAGVSQVCNVFVLSLNYSFCVSEFVSQIFVVAQGIPCPAELVANVAAVTWCLHMNSLYVLVDIGLHLGGLLAIVALPHPLNLAHFGVDYGI